MRSTWKGTVSCGLLNVPAKLYAATEEKSIRFSQVHRKCQQRIEMPKWCPACQRKVETDELMSGYELGDGSQVLFEKSELDDLKVSDLSSIEILEFAEDRSQFDPRLPKKAYFLAADKGGAKGVALLGSAMSAGGFVAIAKLRLRQKEQLGILRPYQQGVLLLQTLFWQDELRPYGELLSEATVSENELELAGTLISKMLGDGNLRKYKDTYRESLEQAIEAKMKGEEVVAAPAPKATDDSSLESLLQASIASK